MRKWVVRFVSLLAYNVLVLLLIGWLTPARVGWAALWAGVVLTAIVIWIKPLVHRLFASAAATSASQRTKAGEKLVEGLLAVGVAFVVWLATVLLSPVSVGGWFWGWVLPPVILLIGWAVYDVIDDRVEAGTGSLYDRALGRETSADAPAVASAPSAPTATGRRELEDGLTDEQRRMLEELGG